MAEWGQGDPRWIVEHRDDGRNVNGWHWEEKSVLSQVKSRLQDTFSNIQVELPDGQRGTLVLLSCKDILGEASINTRKGNKRFCIYDLTMTVEWEVEIAESTKKVQGSLKVSEFGSASEEDGSDYHFECSATGTGTDVDAAKSLMNKHGKEEVRRRLVALAADLKECA